LIAEHEANPNLGKGFVTIPAIEKHFGTARKNSNALIIAYLPIVSPFELEAWNQYSKEKQGWIQESNDTVNVTDFILPNIWEKAPEERLRALEGLESESGGVQSGRRLMTGEETANRTPVEPDKGPFSPIWTFSPPPPADDVGIINANMRVQQPVFQKAVDYIAKTKRPTILNVRNDTTWFDDRNHLGIPQTAVLFPVFEGYNEETSNVVGHLLAVIPWTNFFPDVLLRNKPPVRVVVQNTCDEVFTLEITGRDTKLQEDLHDKTFAYMAIKGTLSANHDEVDPQHRQADEINDLTCQYTVTVYPTRMFKCEYVTKGSLMLASGVIGLFFVTSFLFVVFDCSVRKRTEKVMNVARKQNIIVSSLFPKNVHAKMMAEADQNEKLSKLGKAGIKSYLSADKGFEDVNKEDVVASKPIAGKYWTLTSTLKSQ